MTIAVSGSINYAATADSIICEALEQLTVLGEGETPNQAQIDSCLRTLNMMVKSWQTRKAHLFTLHQVYLFPQTSQRKYTLNSSTTDHITTSYQQTALAADASSGASSISVDSISGISDGDYIGVETTSNQVQWTTVNGTPSGSTITLTDTLTAAASEDGIVFAYTTKANRPMKIYRAVERTSDIVDTPLSVKTYQEYENLSNKTTTGRVNQIYYDPQVSSPSLYLWPIPTDETNAVVLWAQRTIDDFDATTNSVDFPQEWFLALSFNLARYLAPKYGVDEVTYKRIVGEARMALEDAESWDSELMFNLEPGDMC